MTDDDVAAAAAGATSTDPVPASCSIETRMTKTLKLGIEFDY